MHSGIVHGFTNGARACVLGLVLAGGAGVALAAPADENVTVLCDVNQVAIDSAAQRYPQAKTYTDLRRVFGHVRQEFEPLNVLPAWVWRCEAPA